MTENEFLLEDRLGVIRDTITKYGEENFYLSFSGGKDSTVVHHLLDMALPNNKIPRVFSNTGMEYKAISMCLFGSYSIFSSFISSPLTPFPTTLGLP